MAPARIQLSDDLVLLPRYLFRGIALSILLNQRLVDLPERRPPSKAAQQALRILVKPGDVESGGEGLDAVQPPRLAVIYGIARNEVGY